VKESDYRLIKKKARNFIGAYCGSGASSRKARLKSFQEFLFFMMEFERFLDIEDNGTPKYVHRFLKVEEMLSKLDGEICIGDIFEITGVEKFLDKKCREKLQKDHDYEKSTTMRHC